MANEISDTELLATQQDLISSIVLETLKQKAFLIPTVRQVQVAGGQKSVAIPRRTQLSPEDKLENTALTAQEITFATDILNLDKKKAIYSKIEEIPELQANVGVEAELVREMAEELALQVDRDLISCLALASAAGPDHQIDPFAAGKVSLEDFTEAGKLLDLQSVPRGDRFALMSPVEYKDLLDEDKITSVDRFGVREPINEAEVGQLFNFRIMVHNEVAAGDVFFYHKNHCAYAQQLGATFKQDQDLSNDAREFLMKMVYGVKDLDSGKRGVKLTIV